MKNDRTLKYVMSICRERTLVFFSTYWQITFPLTHVMFCENPRLKIKHTVSQKKL